MTRQLLMVVMAVALAGCVESRGTQLAQCEMEARKHQNDEISRYAFTNLCMRSKGYQRADNCWNRYDAGEDAKCFHSANQIARAFDAIGDAIGR
ncbi:entry exclusion lipoprotein TrbK [Ancylobacter polymorphus]